jgi:hypothetical protein
MMQMLRSVHTQARHEAAQGSLPATPMTAGSDVFDGLATPAAGSAFGRPHAVPPLNTAVLSLGAFNGEQQAHGSVAATAQGSHDSDVFDFLQTPAPYRDDAGDSDPLRHNKHKADSEGQPAALAAPAAGSERRPGFHMDVNGLAEGSVSGGCQCVARPCWLLRPVARDDHSHSKPCINQEEPVLNHCFLQ